MRLAVAAALALLASSLPARADWEVKRSPFDARLVSRYKQLLHKNPDDAYALRELESLYKKYRTLDQLVSEYQGSNERIVLGHLYRDRGELLKAAKEYEAAGAGVALADVDVRLDRAAAALPLYRAALDASKDPKIRRPLLRKLIDAALMPSSGLVSDEKVRTAEAAYRELLVDNPREVDTRRELAEMLASHDRPKLAAVEWRQIAGSLRSDPARQADAYKRIGELEESASDFDAALAAYNKTYALAPAGHHLRREAIDKIIGVYRKKDELRTLIGTWEREWPREARGFVEWETLARLHDEVGDPERAKEAFVRALAIDPHALDARRRLIALLEREGKDQEALAEWRKLVQAAPGEVRFRLELAERLWKTPDGSKEALLLCERLGRETSDPSVHGTLAELYTRWGQADRALSEREKLVHLEPNDDSHLIALGELWYQKGKKEKALEIWRRILTIGGKREQRLARLAEVYADHEMPGEALDLYQKAVKLAPADLSLQKGLASALERAHREAEAEKLWLDLFESAAQAGKRGLMLDLRQHLVVLLQREGKLAFRVSEWRDKMRAQASGPARAAWGLLAADAYLKLGKFDAAEEVLKTLAGPTSDLETRVDALIGLGQVYKSKRKLKEAVAALEQAAELMPSRAREIYTQIAELSLQLYRDADALAYAKKAIALGPADAQAQVRLAEVCERRDDADGAVAAYEHALELDDRLWRVYFTLARLDLRRGELPKAAKLYREVIRRAPEEELVVDAARRAIDLEEYLGTLGELERELAPLAYAHPDRKVYQNLLVELYQRHARLLLAQARLGNDEVAARRELQRMGEHALRPLLDLLSVDAGTDAAEQRQAMALLGELGNAGAAAPLLKLALTLRGANHDLKRTFAGAVPPVDLRVEAALAGARLAGVDDLGALLKLAEDPEKNVRAAAFVGLGRLHAPPATEALLHGLSDAVPDLAAVACIGLGRQAARSKSAADQMVKLLRDEARPGQVRAACAFALGAAFDHAPESASIRAALVETLDEGADEAQEKAAWALGRIGARPSAAALVKAVVLKRDPVRYAALAALNDSSSAPIEWPDPPRNSDGVDIKEWVALLGATAQSPSPQSWRIGDGESSATSRAVELANDFADALSRHRDLVLRALADLDARPDGIAAGPLSSGALDAASSAALDELGARLLPLLRKLAAGADSTVAAHAVPVLAKVEGGEVAVIEACASPRLEVRLAALQALAAHPSAGAVVTLEHALSASDWRERRAAALALSSAPPGAVDAGHLKALDAALSDASGYVREAATHGLQKLSRSGDARVRAAASAALASHKSESN